MFLTRRQLFYRSAMMWFVSGLKCVRDSCIRETWFRQRVEIKSVFFFFLRRIVVEFKKLKGGIEILRKEGKREQREWTGSAFRNVSGSG